MQEVFENIIKRLEEQKSNLTDWAEDNAFEIGIENAIEIVKQASEEYYKEKYFNLDHATLHKCPKCGSDAEHRVNKKGSWACGCFQCNLFKTSYDHGKSIQAWEDFCSDNNNWIPCSEKMPPVETEVFILAKRKYRDGSYKYIRTTAMYEDGTVLENDSCWNWEDIDGEWDEENDCYIIPKGWWENRHYNPDEVYNNVVDDEVIAWHPLPEPYYPKGE